MEKWLTTSVPGIVLLGAAGSILSLLILRLFRVVPVPLAWHRKRSSRQAYMLGFSAALIDKDATGRRLVAAIGYHLALLMILLVSLILCWLLFIVILSTQSNITLTWGAFASSAAAFTASYLAYFEFEYIHRTYLFYWKAAMEAAAKRYSETPQDQVASRENYPENYPSMNDAKEANAE